MINDCSVFINISGFLKRLNLFRELNQEDTTVLNYFDELEIHPKIISEFARVLYI